MNRIRWIAAILGSLVAGVLVAITGTTAALAYPVPPPGGPAGPVHPPLRVHTIVTGGMPGWQIALIAIGAALAAAAVAVTLDRVRTAHRQLTMPPA